MGCHYGKKGWKVHDLEANKILFSRDVVFCEMNFPFFTHKHGHLEAECLIGSTRDVDDNFLHDWGILDDGPSESSSHGPHEEGESSLVQWEASLCLRMGLNSLTERVRLVRR